MAKLPDKRKLVRESIRQLQIKDGQILLVKQGSPMADEKGLQRLASIFNRQGLSNCILIVVDNFNDLSVINQKQMNEAGWYRMEETEDGSITIYQDSGDDQSGGAGDTNGGVLSSPGTNDIAAPAEGSAGA